MRRTRPVIAVTALVLALGSAAPAFATDPEPTEPVQTAPPAEPEESDLVEVEPEPVDDLPSVPVKPPVDQPDARACEPGYRYSATSKTKDYHKGVGVTQSNYNGTSRTARSTFTSEVAGKVGVSYSGKLGVKVSVAIVDIESEFNVNVSAEMSVSMGNRIAVDTPPKKSTNAKYGVYRLKSYGYSQYKYANCTNGVKNKVTIYTPRRVGWYIWES
ncbi:hypothetical protein KBY91_31825 [Streptomyces sp. RK23]|uniref:hypothetical protein n=1 Tax=unclassified Streptomyces TaxID=2593676 RepID=UPI001B3724CA|nr:MULTISPECIES: hypothetical protein [unclassified Streptomyces]MBQ0967466.1 hypothetical protein [Streptomyces sp. RK74B]MBQ1008003.1 hypothetical protein [Streptomyces sp. RK23]